MDNPIGKTFLRRKDKVKTSVSFGGRENAHHERGREMLEGIVETLKEVASAEVPRVGRTAAS